MRSQSKLAALALVAFGLALFAWLLYDASAVVETLGLGSVASEALVALAGLTVVAASVGLGVAFWRGLGVRGNAD